MHRCIVIVSKKAEFTTLQRKVNSVLIGKMYSSAEKCENEFQIKNNKSTKLASRTKVIKNRCNIFNVFLFAFIPITNRNEKTTTKMLWIFFRTIHHVQHKERTILDNDQSSQRK